MLFLIFYFLRMHTYYASKRGKSGSANHFGILYTIHHRRPSIIYPRIPRRGRLIISYYGWRSASIRWSTVVRAYVVPFTVGYHVPHSMKGCPQQSTSMSNVIVWSINMSLLWACWAFTFGGILPPALNKFYLCLRSRESEDSQLKLHDQCAYSNSHACGTV